MSSETKGLPNGWKRVGLPWRSKNAASYEHVDGWTLEHCGHQTAIWPFVLKDAEGRVYLLGSAGNFRNPTCGYAWPRINDAFTFVASAASSRIRETYDESCERFSAVSW